MKCAVLAILISSAFARLYTDPSQLKKATYDYVIVGAGTAGNVIAARLTENQRITVLVIEAGVSNEGVLASQIPLLAPTVVPNTRYDWNYTTTVQAGFNGRSISYPRGKLLGGSSSVNYLAYSHGSSDDWDRYAAVTGDNGWKWNNMKQYIQKNEKFVPPSDNHNITGEVDLSVHGFHGAVSVSLSGHLVSTDERVLRTTEEYPAEFPFKNDTSGGDNVIGIGWRLSTIGNGTRSSSATAYLQPAINRPNLDVLINSQVTKLIKDATIKGIPTFRMVEFAVNSEGAKHNVSATREVILSAGSVGTPVLLQLSGIGDSPDLASAGISTVLKSPSVGKNLSDHVFQPSVFEVVGNSTLDDVFRVPALMEAAVSEWNQTRTGPLVYPFANQYGWLRLPNNSSIFQTVADPSAGPGSAHYEIIFADLFNLPGVPRPSTGYFFTIVTALISPTSRGTIRIASSNPFDKPLIDPQYLSTPFDIFTVVQSVKTAKRIASSDLWKDLVTSPFGDLATANTDTEIEAVVRKLAGTVYHPVGTAAMSPRGANWGVVDPDLKVKGANGLRIVDGSVLTFVPSAHTQGPIYLLAERAADLIKSEWK